MCINVGVRHITNIISSTLTELLLNGADIGDEL